MTPSIHTPMHRSLRCVDGIVVGYLLGTGLLLVPGYSSGWIYPLCVALHGLVAVGIIFLGRADSLPSPLQIIRETYPLLLLLLLYGETDLLVGLWHEAPGFDGLVQQWDLWLFGGHPHQHLYQILSGRIWSELFHFLYLSYYILLIGSFLTIWRRHPRVFPRFAFVVTGVFTSFVAIFIAFPVAGPLSSPGVSFITVGVFPKLVAHLYAPLAIDGIHAGAFPSSHVGMSLAIALLLAPRRWWARIALGGLILGIAVSTVYGRFHYAIDAVVGLLAGGILYLLWNEIYNALQRSDPSPRESGRGSMELRTSSESSLHGG